MDAKELYIYIYIYIYITFSFVISSVVSGLVAGVMVFLAIGGAVVCWVMHRKHSHHYNRNRGHLSHLHHLQPHHHTVTTAIDSPYNLHHHHQTSLRSVGTKSNDLPEDVSSTTTILHSNG